MPFYKKISLIIILFFGFFSSYAQSEYPDCINPKNIDVPLSNKIDSLTQNEIYYQTEDKYTYWYKVNVKIDCKVSFRCKPINDQDDYGLLIYNYVGTSFCNDLVEKKITYNFLKSSGTIEAKKGEVYYFGVLHINGSGCGHQLTIDTENKKATIRAIQNECVEEVMETIIDAQKDSIKEPLVLKNEMVLDTVLKEDTMLLDVPINRVHGIVVNVNTGKKIDANIKLIFSNNLNREVFCDKDKGFVLNNFIGGQIIFSIDKYGYKKLVDTLVINDSMLKIEITPIGIGEKLIMEKVNFHPNTYVLKGESKDELHRLSKFMMENNNYFFEIRGHTNGNRNIKKRKGYENLGEEWNFKGTAKKLSQLRAEKIKAYLINLGVKENQLTAHGYGGDQMIVSKPKNMQQAIKNIRVEVLVVQ